MTPLISDLTLAAAEVARAEAGDLPRAMRIESAEAHSAVWAAVARKCWNPHVHIDWRWSPSLCAVFAGHWTHLTQAFALSAEIGADDLDGAERLHKSLLSPPTVHVASLFEPAVVTVENRGFAFLGSADVLALSPDTGGFLHDQASARGVRVMETDSASTGDWIRTVSAACLDSHECSVPDLEIGGLVARMAHTALFHAEMEGVMIGGGAVYVQDGTAILFCDATLPRYRGRGVQSALIQQRIRYAMHEGCNLIAVTVQSGVSSARNYECCGFRKLYARLTFQRR